MHVAGEYLRLLTAVLPLVAGCEWGLEVWQSPAHSSHRVLTAPAVSIGPPTAVIESNLTVVDRDACDRLGGAQCTPDALIMFAPAAGCSPVSIAQAVQAARCAGAIVSVRSDPPGLRYTFDEPRYSRREGPSLSVQLHGVSDAEFAKLRMLTSASLTGHVAARLCKSPALTQQNPWVRFSEKPLFVALMDVVSPWCLWCASGVTLVRLVAKVKRLTCRCPARAAASTRASIWSAPVAPTVMLLEFFGLWMVALGTLLPRLPPVSGAVALFVRAPAEYWTIASTALLLLFWHDAFELKALGPRSTRRRALPIALALLAAYLPTTIAFAALSPLDAATVQTGIYFAYLIVLAIVTCCTCWYGRRVRALMLRRIQQLQEQQGARATGGNEEVATMVSKYRSAALKVALVMATWVLHSALVAYRNLVYTSTPAAFLGITVTYHISYVVQALAKVWTFPVDVTSCNKGCSWRGQGRTAVGEIGAGGEKQREVANPAYVELSARSTAGSQAGLP